MNIFIGIGRLSDVKFYGKIIRFNLVTEHGKPCHIPCLIFDPGDEIKTSLEALETSREVVWLQGRLSSYELENGNRIIRKMDVVTYPKSIRTL